MASFTNSQGITEISMSKLIRNFCPLGNDWYTNKLSIVIKPDETIPDYVEVDKELNELEGKEMIIEDVVQVVVGIFAKYNCKYIEVKSFVDDAVHLPVTVTKIFEK